MPQYANPKTSKVEKRNWDDEYIVNRIRTLGIVHSPLLSRSGKQLDKWWVTFAGEVDPLLCFHSSVLVVVALEEDVEVLVTDN